MLLARQERGEPAKLLDEFVAPCSAGAVYWEAFHELRDQRPVGFGVGALRLEAVLAWLDEQQIYDPLDRDRYRHYIAAMDREYLELEAKRAEKDVPRESADPNDPKVSRRLR